MVQEFEWLLLLLLLLLSLLLGVTAQFLAQRLMKEVPLIERQLKITEKWFV
jgi:hypothetical protein